jgi:hypothetical protein
MVVFRWCRRGWSRLSAGIQQALGARLWARPTAAHLAGTGTDLVRTRGQLLAENAFLRQQLVVLGRQVKRPVLFPPSGGPPIQRTRPSAAIGRSVIDPPLSHLYPSIVPLSLPTNHRSIDRIDRASHMRTA